MNSFIQEKIRGGRIEAEGSKGSIHEVSPNGIWTDLMNAAFTAFGLSPLR